MRSEFTKKSRLEPAFEGILGELHHEGTADFIEESPHCDTANFTEDRPYGDTANWNRIPTRSPSGFAQKLRRDVPARG
jgi:hypothetical protein